MATANIEEELTCSICLELYKDPRLLPCHHSICKSCLVALRSKQENDSDTWLHCPSCRHLFEAKDEAHIESLPKNFTLASIVCKYRESMKGDNVFECDVCEDDKKGRAIKKCLQCQVNYCKVCLEHLHPKRGVLASHKLVHIIDAYGAEHKEEEFSPAFLSPVSEIQSVDTLNYDRLKRERYCISCDKIFTDGDQSSIDVIHEYHDSIELRSAVKQKQEDVKCILARLLDEDQDLAKGVADLTSLIDTIRKKVERKKIELVQRFGQLTEEVERRKLTAENMMEEEMKRCITALESRLNKLEDDKAKTKTKIAEVSDLSSLTNDDAHLFLIKVKELQNDFGPVTEDRTQRATIKTECDLLLRRSEQLTNEIISNAICDICQSERRLLVHEPNPDNTNLSSNHVNMAIQITKFQKDGTMFADVEWVSSQPVDDYTVSYFCDPREIILQRGIAETRCRLSTLKYDSEYTVRVTAYLSNGKTSFDSATFKTDAKVKDPNPADMAKVSKPAEMAIQITKFQKDGKMFADVEWRAMQGVHHYEISYFCDRREIILQQDIVDTRCRLATLKLDTEYMMTVTAYLLDKTTIHDVNVFKTDPKVKDTKPAIMNIPPRRVKMAIKVTTIQKAGTMSADVKWTAKYEPCEYEVFYYCNPDEIVVLKNIAENRCMLTNLRWDSTYTVKVTTALQDGTRVFNEKIFKTDIQVKCPGMATHTTTEKVLHKLEKIPCSFNLKIKGLTQRLAKGLLEKLQREYQCQEYDHPEEQRRYFNLMTYLHYFCRQLEEARHCNREALKMDPECIVSLTNQASISYQERSCDEDCQDILTLIRKAETLCSNRVKLLEGKAEIAYSYARFGIKYYKEAETGYQHVLDEVKDDDSLPSFLWKYGYGLIKRRKLRFYRKGKEYNREVKRAADLLYEVAKQDKSFRFKARAWVELGNLYFLAKKHCTNWQKLFPKEIDHFSEDDMFRRAAENIIIVNDIPALEHYANFLKRRSQYNECEQILQDSLAVKESSRAYQSLADIKMTMFLKAMGKGAKQEPRACIDYCPDVLEILSYYDSASKLQNNYSALVCKAKFLYRIGQFKDAIAVFITISSLLQTNDTQPEELDRSIQVFCQVHHAKCLLGLSGDASTISQAKNLLRSAIEMSYDLQRKRLAEIQPDRYEIMSDQNSDDESSRDEDKLPRMTELQKVAISEMKRLLQNGEQTIESITEEIALCELIKDNDRIFELCTKIEERGIDIVKQIDFAKQLITYKDFDKGLFLLKQMVMSDQLPEQAKNLTITAHVDGAMDALTKNNFVLTGTRLRDAFNVRFRDQEATDRDMLHVFFVAHECNRDITWKLQRLFDNSTKLNIMSCFDGTPGTLKLGNLEDNLQKSYVIAVVMDETDLKNEDFDTVLFKRLINMAQCTQMKHNQSKAIVAIMLSEQVDISSTFLSNAPNVQLRNEFQQDNTFLHDFFMQALLN
ncbi:hypothetical protein ACJMK2_031828 [Sinanodonta woodiana]|uniref:RING-type domain-containing protein n=1 Tax=Sinanodonta woodiana TaxID=1069815 RepID=A0ABD3WZX6_SINWO